MYITFFQTLWTFSTIVRERSSWHNFKIFKNKFSRPKLWYFRNVSRKKTKLFNQLEKIIHSIEFKIQWILINFDYEQIYKRKNQLEITAAVVTNYQSKSIRILLMFLNYWNTTFHIQKNLKQKKSVPRASKHVRSITVVLLSTLTKKSNRFRNNLFRFNRSVLMHKRFLFCFYLSEYLIFWNLASLTLDRPKFVLKITMCDTFFMTSKSFYYTIVLRNYIFQNTILSKYMKKCTFASQSLTNLDYSASIKKSPIFFCHFHKEKLSTSNSWNFF